MNSKEKLAKEIRSHKRVECLDTTDVKYNNTLEHMAMKADQGYYSDYDSPLATPCIQLVKDLEALGLTELSARARNGEFEATEEESNAWYEREGRALALEVTGGNEEIADALFGKLSKEERESKEGIKGFDY